MAMSVGFEKREASHVGGGGTRKRDGEGKTEKPLSVALRRQLSPRESLL